jgi:proteic killer suppression protein
MTKKLRLRLAALHAADSLADFWPPKSGPERCHELKGDLAGTFSIDLKQPYRLMFRPYAATPSPNLPDEPRWETSPPKPIEEQQRWTTFTVIDIFGIEDTHG